MELTNSIRKTVASLGNAKNRVQERCFIAEGTKCVMDTLPFFSCRYLFATALWVEKYKNWLSNINVIVVKSSDIERMSQLTTPTQVLAVYEIPQYTFDEAKLSTNLVLALDRVQDPGNLGTIMRIADWFGIKDILCSSGTVDAYNPKVVQATMGAISRVKVSQMDLVELIKRNTNVPVYGTFLDGQNIYETQLSATGIVIMGNEGQGISTELSQLVNRRLYIPPYPQNEMTSESLNVGMATAITISEFRRRISK
ncbi:MAG: RNA methyltransferase [Muribaculaceae bacterium]|nr:RNA methyltransferase [Muribaculaceae bacterium]